MREVSRENVKFRHFIADDVWPKRFAGMGVGYFQHDGIGRVANSSENIWGIALATRRDGYCKRVARDEIMRRINGYISGASTAMSGIVYTFPDHLYSFNDKATADSVTPILTRRHEYNLTMVLLSIMKKLEVGNLNGRTPIYEGLARDIKAAIMNALVKTEFGV